MRRGPAGVLVVFDRDPVRAGGERLLRGVLRRSLICPMIQDQGSVDVQSHAIRRQRGERVDALREVESSLPANGEAASRDGAIGRVAGPVEIDLPIIADQGGRAAQGTVAVVTAAEGVDADRGTRSRGDAVAAGVT